MLLLKDLKRLWPARRECRSIRLTGCLALVALTMCLGLEGCSDHTPTESTAITEARGATATSGTGGPPPPRRTLGQSANPPGVQHVVTVVLENTDYEQALAQPFLHQLAASGGLLTNYSAVSRPSQPNYFALTAGNTFGASDADVTLDAHHIGDLLEARHKSWKVYAEGYNGSCDPRGRSGSYVRRHEPFISFKNVQTDPARCQRIVNASALQADVAQGTMPNYALYVPDLADDGHDTGVARADRWLSTTFGPLLQDPRFRRDTLFVVTFDEGRRGNHVYTVVSGDAVAPGSTSSAAYNHFSLLRTTEQVLGVGTLGQGDAAAPAITGIWR